MKIFNPKQLFREIPKASIQALFSARGHATHFPLDWAQEEAELVIEATAVWLKMDATEAYADLHHDLQRIFKMGHEQGIKALRNATNNDDELDEAFQHCVNDAERACWALTHRDDQFRAAELALAFDGRSNGRMWKRHQLPTGLELSRLRDDLVAFGDAVAKLYRKDGAGSKHHVEIYDRYLDGTIQLSFYVEGPKSDSTEFDDQGFTRRPIRPAIETGILYDPQTGLVESIVKGGIKAHAQVQGIFGEHILKQDIQPEAVQKSRLFLNQLLRGVDLFDPAGMGIEFARLRRARYQHKQVAGMAICIDAPSPADQPDAASLAQAHLKTQQDLAEEYDLSAVTITIGRKQPGKDTVKTFSFDCNVGGSTSIKNLSAENAKLANELLQECGVLG
ncbi:hypothetical protein [Chitinibacter sp. GC72]|uniref:hypothetical protein n=1 Tax=Chitinibacter sp. GC72 TaxID=1526917 RepID=UPI0012FB6A40|nr:hypothetical protein [Chitinibacter sp. GC72]